MGVSNLLDTIFSSQYFRSNEDMNNYISIAKNMLEDMYLKGKSIEDIYNVDINKEYEFARILSSTFDSEEVIDYMQGSGIPNSELLSKLIPLHQIRCSPQIIDFLSTVYLYSYEIVYKENEELDRITLEVRSLLEQGLKDHELQFKLFLKLADRFLVAGVDLNILFLGYLVDIDIIRTNIKERLFMYAEETFRETTLNNLRDSMRSAEIIMNERYSTVNKAFDMGVIYYTGRLNTRSYLNSMSLKTLRKENIGGYDG